jgi:hypothetical protein
MNKDEALKLALEKVANALPAYIEGTPAREYLAVIHSALAAPVQEPVAWVTGFYAGRCVIKTINPAAILPVGVALYTTPPAAQRQWVGLSHEEVMDSWDEIRDGDWAPDFYAVIEAKLKEKNT